MESTSAPATSSPRPELLVPIHVARRANRSKESKQQASADPTPTTTTKTDSSSLFL
jgi:hypothetical protein